MEVDSNLSSLLRNLTLDPPWIPPKTWDSIPSESGGAAAPPSGEPATHPSQVPIPNLSTIRESVLVRLVLNALHGVKPSLLEIEDLSVRFLSTPADRTRSAVPTFWSRSSSTAALGKMLKSVARSGLLFYSLRRFVNHYLYTTPNALDRDCEMKKKPPYSLVNQAFCVAVGKVLDGYVSALGTLLSSVKLRRLKKGNVIDGKGSLTSAIDGEVTVMEVYLHTKELRTVLEGLANVCLPKVADLASAGEGLSVDTELEFDKFPRGVDLLSYLYVQLKDADPVYYALLRFLYVRSCGPYCGFIKSWIYRASTDDPYGEFFLLCPENLPTSKFMAGSIDYLLSVKERDCIYVPCFLRDICCPLLRAGQQLQVLVKLLDLCNSAVISALAPSGLVNHGDILPFWNGMSTDSVFLLNPLAFDRNGIEALMQKRGSMYKMTLDKLENFFAKLDIRCQQAIPFGTVWSMAGNGKGINTSFSLASEGDLNFYFAASELGAGDIDAGDQDTDTGIMSDESCYEVDPFKVSECSSDSSGEEIEPEKPSEVSSTLYDNTSTVHNFSGVERLLPHQHSFSNTNRNTDPIAHPLHQHNKFSNLSQNVHLQSRDAECDRMPDILGEGFQFGNCLPLGGLLKNPFCADVSNSAPKQLHFTGNTEDVTDGNEETSEGEEAYLGDMLFPFSSGLNSKKRIQIMNATCGSLMCIPESWNSRACYNLSINPVLTKPAWLRTVRNSRCTDSIYKNTPAFPYFNFSSVSDPCKVFLENIVSAPDSGSQVETSIPINTGGTAIEANPVSAVPVQDDVEGKPVLNSFYSSNEANVASVFSEDVPSCASVGESWENLSKRSGKNSTQKAGDTFLGSRAIFEVPLDIIIDKCIVQEILLQYKYVSSFTIKLLEEGFDLRGHLSALRRYHFMEIADWADSFILSIINQRWAVPEPEQKIPQIQGFLDLALQRSSCENDQYKGRLFVYTKGNVMIPHSVPPSGVHTFDFLALGYRVDWPISIIVTQDALMIYAEIFSYLIRVRLAIFSLNNAWLSLKALMRSMKQSQHKDSSTMKDFTVLMKTRQQINHFVSTLQQYVHSQLSDVSWCQFQHSLKHQVKDMLDLEAVHMRYLADALYICFLSDETKAISVIIKNILQCALDFRMCFDKGGFLVTSDEADLLSLHSKINFSQVISLKATFEKNIKDLHLLYLRSPKHGEFGLCRFWAYLNYNDYYSTTIGKETGHLYL